MSVLSTLALYVTKLATWNGNKLAVSISFAAFCTARPSRYFKGSYKDRKPSRNLKESSPA